MFRESYLLTVDVYDSTLTTIPRYFTILRRLVCTVGVMFWEGYLPALNVYDRTIGSCEGSWDLESLSMMPQSVKVLQDIVHRTKGWNTIPGNFRLVYVLTGTREPS